MNDEQRHQLSLSGRPQARWRAEQVALYLNCSPHDIPILVNAKLLKPLGSPAPNGAKYFGTLEILALAEDRIWLARATEVIRRHWLTANGNRRDRADVARIRRAATSRLRPNRNDFNTLAHEEQH